MKPGGIHTLLASVIMAGIGMLVGHYVVKPTVDALLERPLVIGSPFAFLPRPLGDVATGECSSFELPSTPVGALYYLENGCVEMGPPVLPVHEWMWVDASRSLWVQTDWAGIVDGEGLPQ